MAYGQQFDFQMLNDQGILVEAIISANGYTGAVTTLIGGSSPIVLTYDTQSDKRIGMRPSYVTLNMMSAAGFTLSDIFSQDERYWQVTIYYNGALYWQGYVSQDSSLTEPFMEIGTYEMALTARCGLASLQGFKFLNQSGYYLFGYISVTQLLSILFAKTGLAFNFVTAVNIYETRHNTALNALDQTYINTQRFFGSDGLPMQCSDVLEAVCQAFGAICFQRGGQWWFVRQAELPQLSFYYYNPSGGVIYGPNVGDLRTGYGPSSNLKMINSDQSIGYDLGYSELRLKYTFAFLLSAFQDSGFYAFYAAAPVYWTFVGSFVGLAKPRACSYLPHGLQVFYNAPNYNIWLQSKGVYCLSGDILQFNMLFDGTPGNYETNGGLDFQLMHVATAGGLVSYYGSGGWATNAASFLNTGLMSALQPYATGTGFLYQMASHIIVPATGILYLKIFSLNASSGTWTGVGTTILEAQIYKVDPANTTGNSSSVPVAIGQIYDVTQTAVTYTYLPGDKDTLLGDSPSPLYAGALTIDSGGLNVTANWARRGVTESKPLMQIITESAMDMHKKAYRMFSGSTYGIMTFGDCWLIEGLVGANYYVPLGFMIDLKNLQGSLVGIEHDPTTGTYSSTINILWNKNRNFQS